ncbi:MAG TPA: hypothetical protein P5163_00040 [Rubrivivax sp.]|nr:hypothetical protein [Rubrivivax sp.]
MSAFLVNPFHLDALVTWGALQGVRYYGPGVRLVEFRDAAAHVAELLREANVGKMRGLYGDKLPPVEAYAYHFERDARFLAPVQIIKAVHCLDYQCCDAKDWGGAEARTALIALEQAAIRMLPGYELAQWELTPEGVRP